MNRPRLAIAAASAFLVTALAGCTAGSDDPTDALDGAGAGGGPTLYLNVTANGETHRFSTADLPGAGGDGGDDDDDGSAASATATSSSGTVTASGNATAGNGTAQGNATASNGTATGSAGGDPPGGGSGTPGVPSGDAPLDVTVEVGASGLPDEADLPVNWTVDWGDAASTAGGDTSANASANGTAARQQARESGTSFPARLQHKYASAGRYDLSLAGQVAGQALGTLRTAVAVGKGAPAIAPGTVLGSVPFNATGDVPMGSVVTGCDGEGGEQVPWTFLDALDGTPAQVSNLTLSLESSGAVYDVDLYLFAPNGTELGSAAGSGTEKALDLAGPFAPGDYVVSVVGCLSGGGTFALEGAATYVAADRPAT